jgi:predicted flavoprotein YhiN
MNPASLTTIAVSEKRKLSTCGFVGEKFVVVGGGRLNVVNRHSFEMALYE